MSVFPRLRWLPWAGVSVPDRQGEARRGAEAGLERGALFLRAHYASDHAAPESAHMDLTTA